MICALIMPATASALETWNQSNSQLICKRLTKRKLEPFRVLYSLRQYTDQRTYGGVPYGQDVAPVQPIIYLRKTPNKGSQNIQMDPQFS
jgi:hypothetical protein